GGIEELLHFREAVLDLLLARVEVRDTLLEVLELVRRDLKDLGCLVHKVGGSEAGIALLRGIVLLGVKNVPVFAVVIQGQMSLQVRAVNRLHGGCSLRWRSDGVGPYSESALALRTSH